MLWLKQKIAPGLVPVMTLVHAPTGIYPAIRWIRQDEPLPEPKGHESRWEHLDKVLHHYSLILYNRTEHRFYGFAVVVDNLSKVAPLLPEDHPLRKKVVELALLHGCLIDYKNLLSPDARAWYEATIKKAGAEFPPPPKPELKSEPKPRPKRRRRQKHLPPKLKLEPKRQPLSKFGQVELEPIRLPHKEAERLMDAQWKGQLNLKGKWKRWARKRYGSDKPETIKHGIVNKLTEKLIANKKFVEAFVNSPFNFHYATADDALKDKENLRERVYEVIDGFVGVWAQTASDHHPLAWALQIAVAQEFGLTERYETVLKRLRELDGSEEAPYLAAETAFLYNTLKPLLHEYVRAVYGETQEFLKETGLEELYLVRGVGLHTKVVTDLSISADEFKLVEPPFLPASSWSLDYDTAQWFARWMARKYNLEPVLYMIKLPKDAFHLIISTALTGWGCFNEQEIVLAVPEGQQVWAAHA
jgi:hypothetical protein